MWRSRLLTLSFMECGKYERSIPYLFTSLAWNTVEEAGGKGDCTRESTNRVTS